MNSKSVGFKAMRNRSIIFTIVAIILFSVGSYFGLKPIKELIKQNNYTKATGIIAGYEKEVVSTSSSDVNYIPIIDFIVNDQTVEFKGASQKETPELNANVDIVYDSKDPNDAKVAGFNYMSLILPTIFLVLGLIALILAIISLVKMLKFAKRDKQRTVKTEEVYVQPKTEISYAQPHHFDQMNNYNTNQNYNQAPSNNIQNQNNEQSSFVQNFVQQNNQHNEQEKRD